MSKPLISLTNAHGLFEVDPEVLQRAIASLGSASVTYVRQQAAAHAGYPATSAVPWVAALTTALDDCNVVECLIIWVESGNHTF